ncbi:hypothetical protein FA13DRAFT_1718728 [Coprinellus micaceus]|uniref:Uncharacterized protein n=1 Tax=Coprinellus micaceus TaxID=71717 RepID=A0A4Y7SCS9_COPMI|nr:hypothetical protein FA13DRAFT_1718728 [Coprinellus micaceus]
MPALTYLELEGSLKTLPSTLEDIELSLANVKTYRGILELQRNACQVANEKVNARVLTKRLEALTKNVKKLNLAKGRLAKKRPLPVGDSGVGTPRELSAEPQASSAQPPAPLAPPPGPPVQPLGPLILPPAPLVQPPGSLIPPPAPLVQAPAPLVPPPAPLVQPPGPLVQPPVPTIQPSTMLTQPPASLAHSTTSITSPSLEAAHRTPIPHSRSRVSKNSGGSKSTTSSLHSIRSAITSAAAKLASPLKITIRGGAQAFKKLIKPSKVGESASKSTQYADRADQNDIAFDNGVQKADMEEGGMEPEVDTFVVYLKGLGYKLLKPGQKLEKMDKGTDSSENGLSDSDDDGPKSRLTALLRSIAYYYAATPDS